MTAAVHAEESKLPLTAQAAGQCRAALVAWFTREGRDYPWRRTQDPYAILVSEIMLQQTQIATVLGRGYYTRWMEQFPDASTLAAADEGAILKAWEGLGYYSRARNLQRAARTVIDGHQGIFPRTLEEIAALPGVGRYTAGAVFSFAWNLPAPIVDGNVARVLSRLFSFQSEINTPAAQRILWDWAEALLDRKHARQFNSAIMELGQRLCTPRQPACDLCPLKVHCLSAGPSAESLPKKKASRKTVTEDEHALWVMRNGCLLMAQETGSRRKGLWRLPLRTEPECRQLPLISRSKYSITHHRVTLSVHEAPHALPNGEESWQPVNSLSGLAMPGPIRRVVDDLLPRGGGL